MSRKTYRWIDGELVLVKVDGQFIIDEPKVESAPMVVPDLPGYESPVDGRWIEGRRARRNDLARHQMRPWEGLASEQREAAKVRAEWDRKADQLAEKMAHEMWRDAPERHRKLFRGK